MRNLREQQFYIFYRSLHEKQFSRLCCSEVRYVFCVSKEFTDVLLDLVAVYILYHEKGMTK